jgi:very-short-patch-repair endonuclease
MLRYSENLKNPARDLRRNLTDSEQVLWHRLRAKQILGIQFYRQKPILAYYFEGE